MAPPQNRTDSEITLKRLGLWLGVLLPITAGAGFIWGAGEKNAQLEDHERRISKVEAREELLIRIDENVQTLKRDVQDMKRGRP